MWTVLGPLLIELAREWIRDGKPSKANVKVTVEAVLSSMKKADVDDMHTLGCNMQIAGVAIQEIASNFKAAAEIRKAKEMTADPEQP